MIRRTMKGEHEGRVGMYLIRINSSNFVCYHPEKIGERLKNGVQDSFIKKYTMHNIGAYVQGRFFWPTLYVVCIKDI